MAQQVNIHDPAVTIWSLVEQVRSGEEVILLAEGRPIARVVPIPAPGAQRIPGLNRGAITLHDTVEDPLPDGFWLGAEPD